MPETPTNGHGNGSARSVTNADLKVLSLEIANRLDGITSRLDTMREWQADYRVRMDAVTTRLDDLSTSKHDLANKVQMLELKTNRVNSDDIPELIRLLPSLRQISEIAGSITRAASVVDGIEKRLQRVEADTNRVLEDLRRAALPTQEEWDKADELLKAVAAERADRREYRGVWRNNAVAAVCLTIGGPTVFLLLQHFFK